MLELRRAAAGVAVVSAALLAVMPAEAQAPVERTSETAPAEWAIHVDGGVERAVERLPLDSLHAVARRIVDSLRYEGHYFARLDSARADTADGAGVVHLYLSRGPEVLVGAVRLAGGAGVDLDALRPLLATRPGRTLRREDVEADVQILLAHLEASGFPLAQVAVERVGLTSDDPPRLDLVLRVDPGREVTLGHVEVVGGRRTRPTFAARVAGLRPGAPLRSFDPGEIQRRLLATALFDDVGTPQLHVTADGVAVLQIPVEEAPPGTFDLVLGYQPPAGSGGRGALVGSGRLEVQNLFGAGRALALRLHQLPGQASRLEARVADPFVVGLPLSAEARFHGLQQDSTYGKRSFGLRVGYRIAGGLQAHATLHREVTRPGPAGGDDVARADAWFAGIGLEVRRLDRGVNPSRGVYVRADVERGRKERRDAVASDGPPSLPQLRTGAQARLYVPTLPRQVLVLGADASTLLSEAYDRSDLFRYGGAATLRGYDEERFLASTAGRALVEYRYQLDLRSYAYGFFDVGYVRTPAAPQLEPERGFHPGYGCGVQVATAVGLVNVNAAMNPEDGPTGTRIHAGLSFGL